MEWAIPAALAFLVMVLLLTAAGAPRPRRGSYVMPARATRPPAMPEVGPGPVLFHSKYCASRYGSPCNCQRCHCPKGP